MASKAQCAYCFECLSASLEKRPPLSLQQIEKLWVEYTDDSVEDSHDVEHDDDEMTDVEEALNNQLRSSRPAGVSRLLAPSPSSASSSNPSLSSTPSTGDSSTASKSSSRSSIFSMGKKSKKTDPVPESSKNEYPLFVTWNTITRSGSRNLRGCIGTFSDTELDDGLRSYALTSAFDDSRFSPIALRELPSLECGVTLLTNFQPISDPMGWEIGKHGLRIKFTYHGRLHSATYLPDVAKEQGWTKEETMISLMRKAGWNGRRDEWRKVSDLNVTTYQGEKATLAYDGYREWRDWVDGDKA